MRGAIDRGKGYSAHTLAEERVDASHCRMTCTTSNERRPGARRTKP